MNAHTSVWIGTAFFACQWHVDMKKCHWTHALVFTLLSYACPCKRNLHIHLMQGTMTEGPWSYRIGSVLLISPIYACVRDMTALLRKQTAPPPHTHTETRRHNPHYSLCLWSTLLRLHYIQRSEHESIYWLHVTMAARVGYCFNLPKSGFQTIRKTEHKPVSTPPGCTHTPTHPYPQVLMTVGTLAGRHRYFAQMSAKIFKRFLPGGVKPKIKCPKPKQSPIKKEWTHWKTNINHDSHTTYIYWHMGTRDLVLIYQMIIVMRIQLVRWRKLHGHIAFIHAWNYFNPVRTEHKQ